MKPLLVKDIIKYLSALDENMPAVTFDQQTGLYKNLIDITSASMQLELCSLGSKALWDKARPCHDFDLEASIKAQIEYDQSVCPLTEEKEIKKRNKAIKKEILGWEKDYQKECKEDQKRKFLAILLK